ncbi:hypothetical protein GCM10009775_36870 [Microbacterium aoyamense]|uniref:PD-(D/E)XK nuclease superfamily protein n=1 Tax=Microbacterium aoyamense TaxID=344166 RepID=A0ABP5BDI8_9MICO|nr:PD-(D/E)XK nuclease family protein [Microbacterium aoyamense]
MTVAPAVDQMVTALIPSLSRSLADQFNVFRVMHHGTHEKQLSNVFAWLLRPDATHRLGSTFQEILVARVNGGLPAGSDQFPAFGYRVIQEVNTSGSGEIGGDIADIMLTCETASIVIENFESSDGHGHDYGRYLAHGAEGGKQSVVVLLCARREAHRQIGGWQDAVVMTYAELISALESRVAQDSKWRRENPDQYFFINQLVEHFVEGARAVSIEDRISFINTMCETGESARYGYRQQAAAAEEFAALIAQHATRQFEEGRSTLASVKRTLKRYAERTLVRQLAALLTSGPITSVEMNFRGQWEWCVTLRRDQHPTIFLEFGPTAVVENGRVPQPLTAPDYTKVFVTRKVAGDGIDFILQTDVGLQEVLEGLSDDDTRLRDAVLAAAGAG